MTCPSGEYANGGATACALPVMCFDQGGLPCSWGGCTFSKTSNGTLQRSGQCADHMGALMPDGSVISELYLGNRGIRALSPGVFDDIGGIWSLYLSDNELTSLPSGIFDSLTALRELSLQGNELMTLPSGIFDSLTALQTLLLDNNKLEGLSADLFAGLPLSDLYLFCPDETYGPGYGPGQSCGADDNANITCAPLTAVQFNDWVLYGYSGPSERCCEDKGDAYATDGASCVCSPVRAGGSGLVSHGALTPSPCPHVPACACLLCNDANACLRIHSCVCLCTYMCVCL